MRIAQRCSPDGDLDRASIFLVTHRLYACYRVAGQYLRQVCLELLLFAFRDGRVAAAKHLGFAPAKDMFRGRIPQPDVQVEIHGKDGQRRGLDQRLDRLLGLTQRLFELFALGDVMHQGGEKARLAGLPIGQGNLQWELVAAFPDADCFHRFACQTRSSGGKHLKHACLVGSPQTLGDDVRQRRTGHLLRRISKNCFRHTIPERDPALAVGGHNGGVGRFHDRAEAQFAGLERRHQPAVLQRDSG